MHKDGNVIFSHAGIFQEFLDSQGLESIRNPDRLVDRLNEMNIEKLWRDDSPIWARPQHEILNCPKILKNYLQVVGHTPVEDVEESGNVLSVDTFSTYFGKKMSSEQMTIVDTTTKEYKKIDIDFRKTF